MSQPLQDAQVSLLIQTRGLMERRLVQGGWQPNSVVPDHFWAPGETYKDPCISKVLVPFSPTIHHIIFFHHINVK